MAPHDDSVLAVNQANKNAADFSLAVAVSPSDMKRADLLEFIAESLRSDKSPLNLMRQAYSINLARRIRSGLHAYLSLHQTLVEQGGEEGQWRLFGLAGQARMLTDIGEPDSRTVEKDEHVDNSTGNRSRRKPVETPLYAQVKSFAITNDSGKFVVVLTSNNQAWSMHVRQYWDPIANMSGVKGAPRLPLAFSTDIESTAWAIKFAADVNRHSDDLPGVHAPRRPSLASITDGNFQVGTAGAGIALQYGDARDAGFVLSYVDKPGNNVSELVSPAWQEPQVVEQAVCAIDAIAIYTAVPF